MDIFFVKKTQQFKSEDGLVANSGGKIEDDVKEADEI